MNFRVGMVHCRRIIIWIENYLNTDSESAMKISKSHFHDHCSPLVVVRIKLTHVHLFKCIYIFFFSLFILLFFFFFLIILSCHLYSPLRFSHYSYRERETRRVRCHHCLARGSVSYWSNVVELARGVSTEFTVPVLTISDIPVLKFLFAV